MKLLLIINLVYLGLAIFIFTNATSFWNAMLWFFALSLAMALYRLFLTESGKSAIKYLELMVEHEKLKGKLRKENKKNGKM